MCRRMIAADETPGASAASTNSRRFKRQRLAAHDARHVEPLDRADRDEDQHDDGGRGTTISRITKNMNGSA